MKAESTPLRSSAELRAARFDLISRLADDLAHEIKNPLHAMVINLEVLRRRAAHGATADVLERADVIEYELQRVNRLVEQLLLLLRPARDSTRLVALDDVLGEIVPLIAIRANAEHKEFRFEPAGDSCLVRAEGDAIKLAVLAAADWATGAVPHTGGAVIVRARDRGDCALIEIEAHGAPPAVPNGGAQPALDDALALVHTVLRDVGGEMHATEVGAGGYFAISLTLPRSGAA